ncbi:MAG: selenocysteine-specific translation elongation factor [Gemmatimonadota bacterium]
MTRVILGTAGHIDHGKTALVKALTGTDTDRLKEEKTRGITIDLGFAHLEGPGGIRMGVVDVPGHEDFVRTMVAGASGMDVVLLVVAADEGVMPQTREHVAIVHLLGAREMVVALTKADLVEEEWLALVAEEVREFLADTPFAGATVVPTSAVTGDGLDALLHALAAAARRASRHDDGDLLRLPVDRAFTVAGTGTVVTGTLWSGTISVGDTVRILPAGVPARVRGLQRHGGQTSSVPAGSRAAVALAGKVRPGDAVARGSVLVSHPGWEAGSMLTARLRLLPDTTWRLEHNQRVHVHLGTAEVLARCALLSAGAALGPGATGWVQLRLEAPLAARARDPFILRSYSPVTTFAGGRVAEADAPKRRHLDPDAQAALERILDGAPHEAVAAALEVAGWAGVEPALLPLRTGLSPALVAETLTGSESVAVEAGSRLFHPGIAQEADARLLAALQEGHEKDPLAPTLPMAELDRAALPDWAASGLAESRLQALIRAGRVTRSGSGVRLAEHGVHLSPDQERAADALARIFAEAGPSPPAVRELPENLRGRDDLPGLLHHLEASGVLVALSPVFWIHRPALEEIEERVRQEFAGREGLGPADFRTAIPVTRRHLMPILAYLDGRGVTVREGDRRRVPISRGEDP